MINQVDRELVGLNVDTARSVERRLRELGEDDPDVIGRLSADLSDLYAGGVRYRRLVDALLTIPPGNREQLGEVLAELAVEMGHLRYHLLKSVELVEDLAEPSTSAPRRRTPEPSTQDAQARVGRTGD